MAPPVATAPVDAAIEAAPTIVEAGPPQRAVVGPFETPMMPGRSVYYALSRDPGEKRLIAHMHGMCTPPVYSCGQWLDAGAERGWLVCPQGNTQCGDSGIGPASWDEPFADMDSDLERGIAAVARKQATDGGPPFSREGSILMGFSRGGWAAIEIAKRHPGRWPYLILVEADVTIPPAIVRYAKLRAVVFIAAEFGAELPGMKKSADDLIADGIRTSFVVMPKTSHLYSPDFDDIMRRALAFVTE